MFERTVLMLSHWKRQSLAKKQQDLSSQCALSPLSRLKIIGDP